MSGSARGTVLPRPGTVGSIQRFTADPVAPRFRARPLPARVGDRGPRGGRSGPPGHDVLPGAASPGERRFAAQRGGSPRGPRRGLISLYYARRAMEYLWCETRAGAPYRGGARGVAEDTLCGVLSLLIY